MISLTSPVALYFPTFTTFPQGCGSGLRLTGSGSSPKKYRMLFFTVYNCAIFITRYLLIAFLDRRIKFKHFWSIFYWSIEESVMVTTLGEILDPKSMIQIRIFRMNPDLTLLKDPAPYTDPQVWSFPHPSLKCAPMVLILDGKMMLPKKSRKIDIFYKKKHNLWLHSI